MSKTFVELGIPFPLFEGPIELASDYGGIQDCSLCGAKQQHCFRLGIGRGIMLDCPNCRTINGLDAHDRRDGACRQCQTLLPFPAIDDEEIAACYTCVRSGRAALTKDTELGMISWEQAFEGVTHGVPGLSRTDFEMVPKSDDWVGARLPPELMYELLRTPSYITWQGEIWQFCCRRPMVFIGEWSCEEFAQHAPDGDGRRYFEAIVQAQETVPDLWEYLGGDLGVYLFRCPSCDRMTAHWDSS
jgi:uncharacterized protein CbrC (UPF0167 family)